jgi:hypothetical protein
MTTIEEVKKGEHFWAEMNNFLVVVIKATEDDFFVCGGWECPVPKYSFKFISIIDKPIGYEKKDVYYQ